MPKPFNAKPSTKVLSAHPHEKSENRASGKGCSNRLGMNAPNMSRNVDTSGGTFGS